MNEIFIFGSYFTDLTSRCTKFPLPGETIVGNDFKMGPGGKGSNQAIAAHRLGANVSFVTKIGNDDFGNLAIDFYKENGLNSDNIIVDDTQTTGVALIMVETTSAQNEIVIVPGACNSFNKKDIAKICSEIEEDSILLTQLETNLDATKEVISNAKNKNCTVVLNPAPAQPLPDSVLCNVDVITPNETETMILTGIDVSQANINDLEKAANVFFNKGVGKVIITLGSKGVYANDQITAELIPAFDFDKVVDTTGAGDAFNGGFVAALAQGSEFFESIIYGSVASGLSVTRFGTAPAMPLKKEVDKHYNTILNSTVLSSQN